MNEKDVRELLAAELEKTGRRGVITLAAALRDGTDNSDAGSAAVSAILAAVVAEREHIAAVLMSEGRNSPNPSDAVVWRMAGRLVSGADG
jgi:hypothetical protein